MPCVIRIGLSVSCYQPTDGVATASGVSVDSKLKVMSFQTWSAAFSSGQPLAAFSRMSGPSLKVVLALVAGLDHRLDGDAVGGRARGDPHRVADRAAAELQHDVLAEVVEQLVHLAGVNAARCDRHEPGIEAQSWSK